MATFKVGQRVKYVSGILRVPVGTEGTVRGPCWMFAGDYRVLFDGYPSSHQSATWGGNGIFYCPLTDPAADAFLARMKKLGKEPINDAPKVTERIAK